MSEPIDRILEQIVPDLGDLEGEITPLEGGATNRNFRACLGGRDYVIRIPGKETSLLGIDRNAELQANECAAALGVAPAVAAMLTDPPALVTGFVKGEVMKPEDLREPAAMAEIARALGQVHDSGKTVPTRFNSFRLVEEYAATAAGRGVEVPPAYEDAREHAAAIEKALSGPEHDPVLCHNDLLAGNFLRGGRVWIIDWEYTGMGDRFFDLANFAVNNEFSSPQYEELLTAYFDEPPSPARAAALHLMVFMSDFREAMWGVVQQGISDLDFDFAGYATKHFDRMRETAANPHFATRLEEASVSG